MPDVPGAEAPETPAVAPESTAPPPAEAPAAAPAAPDGFDRIYERMDEIAAQQQQMADQFGQALSPPEEEPEFYDDDGELTEEGIRAVVSDYVREQVDAQLAPREQQQMVERRDDEWDALKETYPELQDRKVAQETIAEAMRWANAHNPNLVERPEFVDVIEWVYKVRKYEETAGAQAVAAPGRIELESAAGAAQPAKGSEPDWGDRIVKAAERLRPQI